MTEVQTRKALRRIFDALIEEAERNPAFAQKLARAMVEGFAAKSPPPKRPRRSSFDASQIHAINILRQHGESVLRGTLEQIKAVEELKSVARASGLVLSGGACKARPSRAELITAIVAAAKHYDAQRNAAVA